MLGIGIGVGIGGGPDPLHEQSQRRHPTCGAHHRGHDVEHCCAGPGEDGRAGDQPGDDEDRAADRTVPGLVRRGEGGDGGDDRQHDDGEEQLVQAAQGLNHPFLDRTRGQVNDRRADRVAWIGRCPKRNTHQHGDAERDRGGGNSAEHARVRRGLGRGARRGLGHRHPTYSGHQAGSLPLGVTTGSPGGWIFRWRTVRRAPAGCRASSAAAAVPSSPRRGFRWPGS